MMKLAIAAENNRIHQELGKCTDFLIFTIEDGQIKDRKQSKSLQGHIALMSFFAENGIDALICGKIGLNTRNALQMIGITLVPGCAGDVMEAAENFLAGKQQGDPAILSDTSDQDPDDPLSCLHDCAKCTLGCHQ